MKHKLLGILVASIFTVPVIAAANPSTPVSPTSASTSTANGGAGGAGGSASGGAATGGSATGGTATGGVATGGAASNSITGTSANGNNSTVSVSVSIPSTAGSGTGTGTGDPAGTTAAAGDPGTSAFNTKATVEYGGTYTVKSAPPITAPSLTTTLSDTCMGSVSFGLSLTGFGATAASTMVDQACVRRLDSREFRAMGLNDVALALLCQSDANRKAVEATGHDCPGMARPAVATANTTVVQQPVVSRVDSARVVDTTPPPSAAVVSSVSTPDNSEYRDPYVRRRLGLEPLQDETAAK